MSSLRSSHAQSAKQILDELNVSRLSGLSENEAKSRLLSQGQNHLKEKPPKKAITLLLEQFQGFLILILVAAAVLAAVIGDLRDAIVILIVVCINALLGFYQEFRAEKSLQALKNMLSPEAVVRRNTQIMKILAKELVPGDIVILESGSRVSADGRIIKENNIEVDESTLTGESHTVKKQVEAISVETSLAERSNMLYMNTIITRGRGEMVVTGTGMQTEMGRLAKMLDESEDATTPLQIQLDSLGKRLALIAGIVVFLMIIIGFLRDEPWVQIIMTAIVLAVAAIPEGLPAVATITLALGMRRMAQHGAIVKRLAAVETLGCTTVICSDKTGTLTHNEMTVRAFYHQNTHFDVEGEGYQKEGNIKTQQNTLDLTHLIRPIMLCNDATIHDEEVLGDPMEAAFLILGQKAGFSRDDLTQQFPRVAEIPFDSEHKYMVTFHRIDNDIYGFIKGAPNILIPLCQLDETKQQALIKINQNYASKGLRVLAVASVCLSVDEFDENANLSDYIHHLTFQGLIGLIDPLRKEAQKAIKLCHQAGIAVKMITGDQAPTATAIAHQLSLPGEVLTSQAVDQLSDADLVEKIDDISVFARATPEQKVRIVNALKKRGHVTAMTGDGVNDAPALKSADIGVAMGLNGTDVTKEAATVILTDDNFATIVHAVKEGRTIFDNIIKFVRFQLSTNIGAIITVVFAPFFGVAFPFTPIQLLWVNIIMDGPPAMALGLDPSRPQIMQIPPRSTNVRILNFHRLGNIMLYGITMAVGTLSVLLWAQQHYVEQVALTMSFTTFVLFQVFNVFNARSDLGTAFNRDFFKNIYLWLALAIVVMVQVIVVHWSFMQEIFKTADLSVNQWLITVVVASSVLVLDECRKLLQGIFKV